MIRRTWHKPVVITAAAAVVVLLLVTTAVRRPRSRPADPAACLSRLSAAATADEERQAMDDVWRESLANGWGLSFAAHDASGAGLRLNDPDWPRKVVTIDLDVGGRRLTHRVIRAENVFLLMRE
jgi:hypothetical protein